MSQLKEEAQRVRQNINEMGIFYTIIYIFTKLKKKVRKEYNKIYINKKSEAVGSELTAKGQTTVSKKTYLGDNVNLNDMKLFGKGRITIGDNFHGGTGCMIISEIHNYENANALPYDDSYVKKDVIIGDNVWLGWKVIVLPGVTIGEGAIIQAGSVVVDDIPKGGIAGGHPARVFKKRDMEHYKKLKSKGAFH